MPKVPGISADQRAQERGAVPYTIGGREFFVRKRTNNMMKEWYEAAPEAAGNEAAVEAAEKNPMLVFDSIVKQLNVLLRDKEGNEPGTEFLDEELDIEDGAAILERLSPDLSASEADRGN
jgi:hypothetical protein